ncbi:cation transporter [Haloferax mediterranei ATCC 33500]|uniref:Cation transporter n=2 Tax=Halobacteriales TaxID=2235 RepID=I3R3H2_HALMT|nr:Na+/H+ antiporter subunit E [Haloferax mediterranei]AFK18782.1 putative monovalent cation/H+ antiporter subunit E [Haloferax mediterranei ATCC 33500]AHZ21850.1 cation transporter [Haloferax mediterranei ATCC 33500]EMA03359.1 putative monovalent cation/H+ antiporter subunit E [Haloferax mediterranei ATCC 33500]MDX5988877.1 Na+/H+ antiporter subunit E [Haloferax mediterranei ATCC 33500]QCQ75275.1 cation transporter [Haloferax mediterranei ATCC 33500]
MSRRWPVSGLVMAILWLFVRGVELTPQRLLEEFIIGLGVGMGIAYFFRRFYSDKASIVGSVRVAPYATLYLLTFLWELLTANIDVARRTLAPSMPIDPAVVEVPLRVRSPAAITTIANSITLTPGTLTMDYDDDTNTLYVHSIDGSDLDGILEPIRRWEDYALVIFDEELKPGDPAPQAQANGEDSKTAAVAGGERHG